MLSDSMQLIDFWVFGLVGFLLTIGTFAVASRTKKAVAKAFEVNDFRQQIQSIHSKLSASLKLIEEGVFSSQDAFSLSNVLYQMLHDFTFISWRVKKDINNCVFLLRSYDLSEDKTAAVSDSIIRIESYLKKEMRK